MDTLASMRRTSCRNGQDQPIAVRVAIAAVLTTLGSAAYAEFVASIEVGISHTDNVFLSPSGEEVDDMVFSVAPHINWTYESRSLDADLNYNYNWYKYEDLDTDSSFQHYEASVTPKIGDDVFTMQIGANRSQVITDPEQVIPPGRLPLVNNLTDQDEYYANPIFDLEIGSSVTMNLDYRYSMLRYNEDSIQDNDYQKALFNVDNYRRGHGMTWAVHYDWYKTEYDVSGEWEYNNYGLELGFWVSDTMRVFGSGGKESQWDDPVDRSPKDPYWEAGIAIVSGDKINIEAAGGERSFGSSWRANVDYTFRRGKTSLEYKEMPTTLGNKLQSLSYSLDPNDPTNYLSQPGSAESYLLSRFQWMFDYELRRTRLNLLVYDETRENRVSLDGIPVGDQAQSGVDLRLSWEVGTRTELVLGGSFANRETSETQSDNIVLAKLTINYALGRKLRMSLIYDHSMEEPESETTGPEYTANVASLVFAYTF